MKDLSNQAVRELIADVQAYYGEGCFACGAANPHGLRMEGFHTRDGQAMAEFRPRQELRGTYGTVHGGVVTTTLDEISVWAAILFCHTMVVTGRIEVRFHRPARVDDPELWVRGRVTDRRGKRLMITGELVSGQAVCASSEGLFIATESLEEMGIRLRGE
ncbi:MAG: PaaI family thioesterase [Acidimicrobiia bacterium]|nr:PaaI family thioesterase [Acidimicrobiia bacterium]